MEAARAMLHDQDLPMHGQKLLEQWCMYRTVLHTEYSRTRHLKKSFLARNQKSAISEYSVVQCTYSFQKRRTKLDPSGKKGIFVGYSKSSKAYRIYFLGYKKIQQGCDI